MKKFLILGAMPPDASPQTHYAAGPWCFSGQESSFPGWEKDYFFAPEPLADSALLPQAANLAKNLCYLLVPIAAKELSQNPENLPKKYWETLLVPFCIAFASQLVERQFRINAIIARWQNESLIVPMPDEDLQFSFLDENDFNLRGLLGITYNWWLFSRLLEFSWPHRWEKLYMDSKIKSSLSSNISFKTKILHFLRGAALSLPFPRLKEMSPWQTLFFSLALFHYCKTTDHALTLGETFSTDDSDWGLPDLPRLEFILKRTIPESLKKLSHPDSIKIHSRQRLRIASIAAYENCAYRQKLAKWKASGNRLGWVQHGGNYGQVKVACNSAVVEYADSVFFTWGWQKHGIAKGNFLPMPYPQLQKIRNVWRAKTQKVIFAGTEMACFGYRLESRPTPLQFLQYRNDKLRFLSACDEKSLTNILYRPYFSLPGLLEDGPVIQKHFPATGICKGPLLPWVLSCKMLVLDHHGTTMLEALAANAPLLLFWNREYWPLCQEGEDLLKLLESAGIWHPTPESAARKFNEIYADPETWWNSAPIQKCRKEYCKFQAWTIKSGINSCWFKILRNL